MLRFAPTWLHSDPNFLSPFVQTPVLARSEQSRVNQFLGFRSQMSHYQRLVTPALPRFWVLGRFIFGRGRARKIQVALSHQCRAVSGFGMAERFYNF